MLDADDADVCDVDQLRAWVRDELGDDRELTVTGRASGGSSNITLFVDVGDDQWVLRRPPAGELLPTSHDMLREYDYISAVHGSDVPVAEPIAKCADPSVLGVPFILLRRVPGLVMSHPDGRRLADDPQSAASLTRSMITVLARLHSIDWAARGLEARSGRYLDRQVRRWTRQLELTPTASRLGAPLEEITQWIHANVPDEDRRAIVHGDFSLNNVIVSPPPAASVAAVVDWEMATIGDPVTDLVWLLRGWGAAATRSGGASNPSNWITSAPGALGVDEAIARYEAETGTALPDLRFYDAFCAWKGIAILEGLYAGWVAGTAADPTVAAFERSVPRSVAELHRALS